MTTTWHRLGSKDELLARVPCAVRAERHSIALFFHDGAFRAIGNGCNHKGGPLCEGRLRDEFVMCPWHGWEYSVITGNVQGDDEEQVPVFSVEERADGVYLATPPRSPRKVVKYKPHNLLDEHPKPEGAPPRVLGISTTAMDSGNPRFSTSDALLDHALTHAAERLGAETQLIRLRDLEFRHCEGNYSKSSRACTWPCAITERDPTDQLTPIYEGLVHWADVILLSTPIRWGNLSSLYYKMIERLNCVQNQITTHNRILIHNKVAAFIITGGQDNVQAVAGQLLMFWGELGFSVPPFPFIAHSRGWDAEDMERNVRQVKASVALRAAAGDLVERALDFWKVMDRHRVELAKPMERSGRKAQRLAAPPEMAE